MATDAAYIAYVEAQVADAGIVRSRRMFGEYMVYVNDKPLLLVCDNTVFVKMRPELADLMAAADTAEPYPGAKPHYLLDIDNRALSLRVLSILEPITPLPARRARRPAQ